MDETGAQPGNAAGAALAAPATVPGTAADPATSPSGAIARLADDLLPALIARLDASGLGELEVRTDAWRIRLRKPYDRRRGLTLPEGRRRPGEPAEAIHGRRGEPGHSEYGRSEPAHPSRPDGGHASRAEGSHGDPPGGAGQVGGGDAAGVDRTTAADPLAPAIAASPAVGYFTPRDGWTTGRHVRSGDVVGYVDCLGVRQDVLAPVDGFLGRLLAQGGEAVEYGQPLVHLDLPQASIADHRAPDAAPTSDDASGHEILPPPPASSGPSDLARPAPSAPVGSEDA